VLCACGPAGERSLCDLCGVRLQVPLDGVSVDFINPSEKIPSAALQEMRWWVWQQCAARWGQAHQVSFEACKPRSPEGCSPHVHVHTHVHTHAHAHTAGSMPRCVLGGVRHAGAHHTAVLLRVLHAPLLQGLAVAASHLAGNVSGGDLPVSGANTPTHMTCGARAALAATWRAAHVPPHGPSAVVRCAVVCCAPASGAATCSMQA
jgi:hypothetical protein